MSTIVLTLILCSCQNTAPGNADNVLQSSVDTVPEPASKISTEKQGKVAFGNQFMVVTANPHASRAAEKILLQGGSAMDAGIAAQMMLGLTEPQSSGIGGGGFLMYWNAGEEKLYSYDGRETAPVTVDETLFLQEDGKTPLHFFDAVIGGRSVGVPGLLAMLHNAHQQHGQLPWATLFDDAIDTARNGFPVSQRLHQMIRFVPKLDSRDPIKDYLFDDNQQPLAVGHLLKNLAYAKTLETLANDGIDSFYHGPIAQRIVEAVNRDNNAGQLSLQDMQNYRAKQRSAVCKTVFEHRICGAPPPSSGATTVLSILGMLENIRSDSQTDSAHYFAEASLLAFTDRNAYLADPDFVDIPLAALLADSYLASRAALINSETAMSSAEPGQPDKTRSDSLPPIAAASPEMNSTTHLSIVDSQGNILSMTTSIETAFGSRLMVDGFLLNNQLTDFSFVPVDAEQNRVANRVEGGKRPRSSMTPVIIFDQKNRPVMALGSPGGTRIIGYVARVIYQRLSAQRELYDAIADSHIIRRGEQTEIETGANPNLIEALEQKGHQIKLNRQTSGISALEKLDRGWQGVADPRREGIPLGQ